MSLSEWTSILALGLVLIGATTVGVILVIEHHQRVRRRDPSAAQLAEGFVSQTCRHCGTTCSERYRAVACSACGKGYGT